MSHSTILEGIYVLNVMQHDMMNVIMTKFELFLYWRYIVMLYYPCFWKGALCKSCSCWNISPAVMIHIDTELRSFHRFHLEVFPAMLPRQPTDLENVWRCISDRRTESVIYLNFTNTFGTDQMGHYHRDVEYYRPMELWDESTWCRK